MCGSKRVWVCLLCILCVHAGSTRVCVWWVVAYSEQVAVEAKLQDDLTCPKTPVKVSILVVVFYEKTFLVSLSSSSPVASPE